jgi:hypothetical protein
MGSDVAAGEVTQLFVPGGWWKASEIPEEDRVLLDAPNAGDLKERIGCLITEIVIPGWIPEQHMFIDEEKASRRPDDADQRSSKRCGAGNLAGRHMSNTFMLLHEQPAAISTMSLPFTQASIMHAYTLCNSWLRLR